MIFDLANSSYLGEYYRVKENLSHRKFRQDVAKLFEPSVEDIIAAFEQQRSAASVPITVSSSPLVPGGTRSSLWIERVSSGWLRGERLAVRQTHGTYEYCQHHLLSPSSTRVSLLVNTRVIPLTN